MIADRKKHKCPMCEYETSKPGNLKEHIRTHTGQCYVHGARSVPSYTPLPIHAAQGERPFCCTECDYATSFQSALMTHIRTHSGERPYKCSHCPYAAPTKSDLTKHARKHAGVYTLSQPLYLRSLHLQGISPTDAIYATLPRPARAS